jgi:hypothetical protein
VSFRRHIEPYASACSDHRSSVCSDLTLWSFTSTLTFDQYATIELERRAFRKGINTPPLHRGYLERNIVNQRAIRVSGRHPLCSGVHLEVNHHSDGVEHLGRHLCRPVHRAPRPRGRMTVIEPSIKGMRSICDCALPQQPSRNIMLPAPRQINPVSTALHIFCSPHKSRQVILVEFQHSVLIFSEDYMPIIREGVRICGLLAGDLDQSFGYRQFPNPTRGISVPG